MHLNKDNDNLLRKIEEYVGDRKYRLDCRADGCKPKDKGFRPPFFLEHVILKHHLELPRNYECADCHASFFGVLDAVCHGLNHSKIVTCDIQKTVQDFRQLNIPKRREQGKIWEAAYYTYNISIVHDAVKRLIDDGFLQYGPALQEMGASADAGAVERMSSLNFESIFHGDQARPMERQNGKRRMNDEEYDDNREFSKSRRTEKTLVTYDTGSTPLSRTKKNVNDNNSFNKDPLPNQHQMDYHYPPSHRPIIREQEKSPQKRISNEMSLPFSSGTWSEMPSETSSCQINYTYAEESLRRQRFQEMKKADNLQKDSSNDKATTSTSRKTSPQQKQRRQSGTVRIPPVRGKSMIDSSPSPPKSPRGYRFDPGRSPLSPRSPYFGADEDDEEPFFFASTSTQQASRARDWGRQDKRGRRDERSDYGIKRDYSKSRPNY